MIFREHRASYVEALKTQVVLPDKHAALIEHLQKIEPRTLPPITAQTVTIVPYATGKSLVLLDGFGILGYLSEGKLDA